MPKYVIVTCLTLFWVFYEMSGGADFEPSQRQITSAAPWHTTSPAAPIESTMSAKPNDLQVTQHQSAAYDITRARRGDAFETPAVVYAAAAEVVETDEAAKVDLRLVVGNRVNMREGPGTNHPVLTTVSRGAQAEVVGINDEGWAQIRLVDGGASGWMAARLLGDG